MTYDCNGQRLIHPDIRLVYWCGGNLFHHHQDLARLREAFTRPETVVHDPSKGPGCSVQATQAPKCDSAEADAARNTDLRQRP